MCAHHNPMAVSNCHSFNLFIVFAHRLWLCYFSTKLIFLTKIHIFTQFPLVFFIRSFMMNQNMDDPVGIFNKISGLIKYTYFEVIFVTSQLIFRRCSDPRPTFLYYEDFRAHLRVVNQRRNFDRNDLILFESWPGNSRYVQNRRRNQRTDNTSSGLDMEAVAQLISSSVSEGITHGMSTVLDTFMHSHKII